MHYLIRCVTVSSAFILLLNQSIILIFKILNCFLDEIHLKIIFLFYGEISFYSQIPNYSKKSQSAEFHTRNFEMQEVNGVCYAYRLSVSDCHNSSKCEITSCIPLVNLNSLINSTLSSEISPSKSELFKLSGMLKRAAKFSITVAKSFRKMPLITLHNIFSLNLSNLRP